MKKVLVTFHLEEDMRNFLRQAGDYDFRFYDSNDDVLPSDCDAQIVVGHPSRELVSKLPNLEFVQLTSAGANTLGWLPENVLLLNAYGAYGPAIAEHMLACTLMCQKDLPDYMGQQRRHEWRNRMSTMTMWSAKVLSVGMGAIGTEFLRRCADLGAECYGVRRFVHDRPDFVKGLYTMDDMDEILPECDVVALSLPETAESVGLFDERRLRLMKPGSILLNVGRGTAIVTGDLMKVAAEGKFRGVCLDVTDPEPLPADHPLWDMERVYITPHMSGGFRSGANFARVMDVIRQNLIRADRGEPFLHIVDRSIGY